jgi:hypothetical protein
MHTATSHLWSLLIFTYHQFRAKGRLSDGLSRQQQAILRTQPSPSSLMADSVKLWWLWRKHNERVLLRSITQFLLAACCAVGFVAASISSSFVVTSSDLEILVQSPSCGFVGDTTPRAESMSYTTAIRTTAVPYAQECYGNSTSSSRCRTFLRPSIAFQSKRSPCPFRSDLCVDPGDGLLPAFSVDSGLVETNDGLGLNLPDHERVYYRKRTTCAVLPLEGYTNTIDSQDFPSEFLSQDPKPGDRLLLFHYGDRPNLHEWRNTSTYLSLAGMNATGTFSMR